MVDHSDSTKEPLAPARLRLTLSARALLIICLFIQAWLIILHFRLAGHSNPGVALLGQAFDLTREASVPTFFACLQALGIALTALAMVFVLRSTGASRDRLTGWLIAAAVFLFVALDDAAGLHERAGSIVSLDLMAQLGYPSYPWHLIFLPLIGGGILLALHLVWADLSKIPYCKWLIGAALACFVISQGIDFVEGVDRMSRDFLAPASKTLPIWMALEEALEMCGTALIWCAFVATLRNASEGMCVELVATAPRPEVEREGVYAADGMPAAASKVVGAGG